MRIDQDIPQDFVPRAPINAHLYKVPRRFDLATMLVVTLAFAMLLGALNAFDAPVGVQVTLSGLLWLVGGIQMIVSARYVRWAAVISGWAVCLVAFAFSRWQSRGGIDAGEIIVLMTCGVFWASLLGYIAGVVVAGVFLVADHLRKGAIRALGREK